MRLIDEIRILHIELMIEVLTLETNGAIEWKPNIP